MKKKLLRAVLVFWGITVISFFIIHLAPGSALDAKAGLNPKMSGQARAKLAEMYGLDRPVAVQYADWVSRVATLDFGRSLADGEGVLKKIARAIPVTLGINALAIFLMFAMGIPLGVYGALHRGRWPDKVTTFAALSLYSMPTFWLALLLMSFFGVTLRLLPVAGMGSIFHDEMPFFERLGDTAAHLVLPISVAVLTGLAGVSRFVRASMVSTLDQPFILAARSRGIPERRVVYRHALKNALLPVITLLGLSVPGLLGGSVVFETIFSIPGMGRLFYQSVFSRDYPMVMGILVIGALLTLLGNLLADAVYRKADPRIQKEDA